MIEDHIPLYYGNVRNYLEQIRNLSKRRQIRLLDSASEECELIIESYWYTFLLSELIVISVGKHYGEDTSFYQSFISKWSGVWTRLVETLNLLFDSMIIGLEGRSTSATNLLRPALESITTGVFYHYLAQKEYRDEALVVNQIRIGRNEDTFTDLIEEAIESIPEKSTIPLNLEAAVTKIALMAEPHLHVPKFKTMLKQIGEWGIVNNTVEELVDQLYSTLWISLSSYSHSLHEGTYIKNAMFENDINILLGKQIDFNAFKDYSKKFKSICYVALILYLNSTEEIQRIETFSAMFSEFLKRNPTVREVLKDVIDQIEKNILSSELKSE